jgi:hypothetical protein
MKTREEVESAIEGKRTASGGFLRADLAEWGVPWPKGKSPPAGWKNLMIDHQTLSYPEAVNRELDAQCDNARDCDRT